MLYPALALSDGQQAGHLDMDRCCLFVLMSLAIFIARYSQTKTIVAEITGYKTTTHGRSTAI